MLRSRVLLRLSCLLCVLVKVLEGSLVPEDLTPQPTFIYLHIEPGAKDTSRFVHSATAGTFLTELPEI